MLTSIRRRQHVRVTLPRNLRGSVRVGDEVRVINLSAAGAMIEHTERLALRETRILSLHLSGLDFRLPARVVWSHLHRREANPPEPATFAFRSGLHFAELSREAARDLRHYLATLSPPLP